MNTITDWVMGHKEVTASSLQRTTHAYVIGQPGTGKSRALESWIMQDIIAGRGVGVIDPHGDLFNNLVTRIAKLPEQWDRVILIDPLDPKWVVGFNPLEAVSHLAYERLAIYMTDVCIKIWKLSPASAPRLVWLLTNSFLALTNLNLTLLELPKFLMDTGYRAQLIPHISLKTVRDFFIYEFPKSEGAIHQWVTPVLNKIGGLIFDPDIRLMFASKSTIHFREVMDKRMILLVNLPKGVLGEGTSSLLAAFIVAHIQKSSLARADTAHRPPFYFYLDEFQNYSTDNIKDILSESRKYALSLTLAHQYLDQLSMDLRSAVLNTAGSLISFRVGFQDAQVLAKEIFPNPQFIQHYENELGLRRANSIPIPTLNLQRKSTGWDDLTLMLTKLKHRQFWYRRRGSYKPLLQHTFDMPDTRMTDEMRREIEDLREYSGKRYGIPKQELMQAREAERGVSQSERKISDTDIPFWTE